MAESDEEIRIRFSVEDEGAKEKVLEIRAAMDELIRSARAVATETNETLAVAFAGVRADKIEELTTALKQAKSILSQQKLESPVDENAVARAEALVKELTNELNIYKKAGSLAYSEVSKEATKFSQTLSNLGQIQRTSIEQTTQAQREWEQATKQGLSQMSANAQAYGTSVGKVSQIIQSTSQRTGQSFQQVANRMTQLGVPVNLVNNAMKQLNMTVQQVANNIQKVAQNTGQTFQQVANQLQSMGVPLNKINAALQQLSSSSQQAASGISSGLGGIGGKIGGLVSSLGNLGNVAGYVFGSVLGITAITVLRDLARAFTEFAKDIVRRGTEMTEVMFTLEVAIRGLQRTGMDTTIEEWTNQIQALKKEFPFFPKREFVEATSLAALMTREFGFTADQISNIVKQSAILAQITGKDLNEAVRGVTYAIGSGYFESLQRAGVNISRQIVANEALAEGYTGVYNELEQTVRAQVTYNVIQQNLAAIQDDASKKTQTFAGQVQILNSRIEDMKNLFGQVVTASDSLIGALETVNEALKSVYELYEALAEFNVDIFAPLKYLSGLDTITQNVKVFIDILDRLSETLRELAVASRGFANVLGAFATVAGAFGLEGLSETLQSVADEIFNVSHSLEDLAHTEPIEIPITIGGVTFSQEEYNNVVKATEELANEVFKIEEEANEKRVDIQLDYNKDIEKIREDHNRKMEDLAEDHQNRLDEIELKRGQRIADEITDYNYRVADAQRDAAQRREDAERKYRDRELREERKFQEKLRQLRENFLLDLEDAVRERDARQIIRLTRQYNLRRDQMVREEKLNTQDRKDAFQEELAQIERQRQERLQQLYIENQRRLQEIDAQAQRERDRENLEWERKKADENRRWVEQRAERKQRRDEQFDDLDQETADRIAKVIQGLQDEYGLTEQQLDLMVMLWKNKFGAEGEIAGWVDQGVTYVIARMQQLAEYMAVLRAYMGQVTVRKAWERPDLYDNPDNAGAQAEGGTIIAKKPTVALFGEAGPEMATFTPLNDIASTSPAKMLPSDVSGMSKEGLVRLELLLSPDLEARIIDNTLGEIADVNFKIERARK